MITLTKDGNAIKFEFDGSQHYLQGDGVIEVPVNSLTLITDESEMATFRKAASNDIFISALYSDFGMSRSELINWYKTNMVGSTGGGGGTGSGVTSGEVQTMIDQSISGKADTSAVTASINAAVSGKADTSAVTAVANDVETLSATVETKQDALELYSEEIFEDDETGEYEKTGKIDAVSEDGNYFADVYVDFQHTDGGENYPFASIDANTNDGEGYATMTNVSVDGATAMMFAQEDTDDGEGNITTNDANVTVSPTGVGIYVNTPDDTTELSVDANGAAINGNPIATEGYVDAAVSGKSDTSAVTASIAAATSGLAQSSAVTAVNNALTAHTADTGIHVSQQEKNAWNAKAEPYSAGTGINITDNVISATGGGGSGASVIEVTQAQYDALVSGGTVDPDALYVITDAPEINLSGYAQSSAVTAEITAAVSGKADTTAVTAISDSLTGKVDTTAITTSVTSGSTDAEIPTAKAVYDAIPTGGTGASYSAGTNISIDTANTINCTLPITADSTTFIAGTATKSANGNIQIGSTDTAMANHSSLIVIGNSAKASDTSVVIGGLATGGTMSFGEAVAIGFKAKATGSNQCLAIGSRTNATGTTKTNINNQITVDTSNQVYISNSANTTTYCVQQKIETTEAALGGLKFVQCTQAEYDALVQGGTVDSSTIYFITNVVS